MNESFEYKGYKGSIETSIADMVMHGSILFVRDLVTYEAETIQQLKEEFEISVDDYLETCKEIGKDPDKPFSGSFQVRTSVEDHRAAAIHADALGVSLNKYTVDAISEKLKSEPNILEVNHTHRHIVEHKLQSTEYEIPTEEESKWGVQQNTPLNNIQTIQH